MATVLLASTPVMGQDLLARQAPVDKKVRAVAKTASIEVLDKEFHCKGEFKGMNKGRPNADDIKAAIDFVRNLKKELG